MAAQERREERTERETELLHRARSRRGLWTAIVVVVVVAVILSYGALSGWFSPPAHLTLVGAGATFPQPLITQWTAVYVNQTGVRVNYQSVGSGAGITSLANKAVDFAASDAPLQASDRTTHPSLAMPNVLHIPETIGAVTFAYNLPGIATGLNVTGEVLVEIFLGQISTWNDAKLQSLNPDVVLPSTPITVVHRSDASGTTFVWTSYLHESNATAWDSSLVGKGGFVWPTGVGQAFNAGVAGYIRNNPNSAGYVELAYTVQNSMTVAKVQNPAGSYILPTLASTAAAAANAVLPSSGAADWANVSILNAAGANSYPISSLSYLLVYKELNTIGSSMTSAKAQALVDFLWWVVHDGQNYSASLTYVPLPPSIVTLDAASIQAITYNGQTLHS